ncbi:hypothetical protein SJI00_01475 [Pseudomonas sp. RP23018S]|uniref:hypothetical protein n=1 Tax=Pseudomonas sp. RP23018S TaxID=3096037 RepID=UPI002AC9F929|nr:hypothetical protein [Pseudomonas sp. RP23018S]MDZ5601455.1 hypothetical protein [Pseudomonas sp. RP23018S]
MNSARFDSIVKKLSTSWEFDALLKFFREEAKVCSKHLEFCVYLADIGRLRELHEFISSVGLYDIKAIAEDESNVYEKRGNAQALLKIYEQEMLMHFERKADSAPGLDGELLRHISLSDKTILAHFILEKREAIFLAEQSPKTLMYFTYALNELIDSNAINACIKPILENIDNFKKMSSLRKAYITQLIAKKTLSNSNLITFPKVGYNELHKLLGIVIAQKQKKEDGAARLYSLISDIIQPELKRVASINQLGSDVKPRVAVCLSGMYRCGNLALDSIYKNVIQPLNADVFFHSWTEMQVWPGLGGAGDDWLLRIFNKDMLSKCPPALRSKRYFKSKFPRTYEIIDTPKQAHFSISNLPPHIKFDEVLLEDSNCLFRENPDRADKFLSLGSLNQAKMLYGIYKSHELAVTHEKKNNFRYDYIVRCRPDIGIHNSLSYEILENLMPNEVGMDFTKEYGPQDQFWYGPRKSALSMASLWNASLSAESLSPFTEFPQMRAHGLIFGWMAENHLQPIHTPLKRDMKMATAKATPPDFSAALDLDFSNEASEFRQNTEVEKFFNALAGFNKV